MIIALKEAIRPIRGSPYMNTSAYFHLSSSSINLSNLLLKLPMIAPPRFVSVYRTERASRRWMKRCKPEQTGWREGGDPYWLTSLDWYSNLSFFRPQAAAWTVYRNQPLVLKLLNTFFNMVNEELIVTTTVGKVLFEGFTVSLQWGKERLWLGWGKVMLVCVCMYASYSQTPLCFTYTISKDFIQIDTSFLSVFVILEAEWQDFYIMKWRNTLDKPAKNLTGLRK